MMIKDPKHVHKHRVVMISVFVGIIIIFGVWAVQIRQMFANEASDDLARSMSGEGSSAQNYIQQLQVLLPGIDQSFEELFSQTQREAAQEQAQQESEDLVADELMKRFNEANSAEDTNNETPDEPSDEPSDELPNEPVTQ